MGEGGGADLGFTLTDLSPGLFWLNLDCRLKHASRVTSLETNMPTLQFLSCIVLMMMATFSVSIC